MISIKNDQRGIAHLALILLAVIVAAAVGFAGYRVTSSKGDSKASVSGQSAASDKAAISACNKVYHDKDLCKFTGNYAIDKLSYKMAMTMQAKDGNSSITVLSDGKGNSSANTTASGQGTTALVQLDGVTYMKNSGESVWTKFPKGDNSVPKQDYPTNDVKFDTATDAAASSKLTYKKLGKEKCGDLTCFKYQMIDSSRPNATDYFWFDTKDYRMQHWNSKDENGTTDMVITYQKVNISAPSPVKEFSAGLDAAAQAQALQQAQAAASAGADDNSN
jgi:hypothetical protein